jgi:HSF-type DNA-binding
MLVLLHIDKEQSAWIEANGADPDAEPPVPPIEWCTKNTGGGSDHIVVMYDADRVVAEILPRFAFEPTSTQSFIRKISRWGFRQVSTIYGTVQKNYTNRPSTTLMYACDSFRRGNFALLSRVKSETAEKRRYQEKLAQEKVPDSVSPAERTVSKRRPESASDERSYGSDESGDSQLLEAEQVKSSAAIPLPSPPVEPNRSVPQTSSSPRQQPRPATTRDNRKPAQSPSSPLHHNNPAPRSEFANPAKRSRADVARGSQILEESEASSQEQAMATFSPDMGSQFPTIQPNVNHPQGYATWQQSAPVAPPQATAFPPPFQTVLAGPSTQTQQPATTLMPIRVDQQHHMQLPAGQVALSHFSPGSAMQGSGMGGPIYQILEIRGVEAYPVSLPPAPQPVAWMVPVGQNSNEQLFLLNQSSMMASPIMMSPSVAIHNGEPHPQFLLNQSSMMASPVMLAPSVAINNGEHLPQYSFQQSSVGPSPLVAGQSFFPATNTQAMTWIVPATHVGQQQPPPQFVFQQTMLAPDMVSSSSLKESTDATPQSFVATGRPPTQWQK